MANDSWDWPAAFERAGKDENLRLTETLKPEDFARALRSMWVEHGMLERSDPRVQEFSRSGRLEWWDGRGRCVELLREGSRAHDDRRRFDALNQEVATTVYGGPITDVAAFRAQAGPGAVPTYPFPPKGFAPPLGQPFTHPLSEPDPTPGEFAKLRESLIEKSGVVAAPPLVVGPPPGPPGVDLGPPKVELREEPKAKGKKK